MSNLPFYNFTESDNDKTTAILSKTFGLGKPSITKICRLIGICGNQKFLDFNTDQSNSLLRWLSYKNVRTEQELRKTLMANYERSLKIKSYRGLRKVKGYPANGQRTRSNAKTARKKKFY